MTKQSRKPNIKNVSISVDLNRFDRDAGNVAMLFDQQNQCFYTVPLSVIVSKVKDEMAQYKGEVMSELNAKSNEIDAKIEAMREQQNKFIADSVETNNALIALVEKGA